MGRRQKTIEKQTKNWTATWIDHLHLSMFEMGLVEQRQGEIIKNKAAVTDRQWHWLVRVANTLHFF